MVSVVARLRFTGEFVGGVIAGFGIGMATAIGNEWPYPVDIHADRHRWGHRVLLSTRT